MKYNIEKGEDKITIADDKMRVFRAWASVEVPDKQNEIVSVEDLKKLMPILMDRGGMIMDRHTNRPVGKILNYEVGTKDGKPGILITGKIFDHYPLDDEIWNAIKRGEIKGLSIGGRGKVSGDAMWDEKEGRKVRKLDVGELYEISVTPNPANPEATIEVVSMAKSSDSNMEFFYKPFGAWKNFQDCVDDMKSQGYDEESAKRICGYLQSKLEKDDGRPPKDWWDRCVASASKVTDTPERLCGYVFYHVLGGERSRAKEMDDESLSKTLTEAKKMAEEKKVEEVKPTPKVEEEKTKDELSELAKVISEGFTAMGSKLDKILDLLSSQSKVVEEEKGDAEKAKKLDIKVDTDRVKKEVEAVLKEMGITKVETPRPQATAPVEKAVAPSQDDLALKIARGEVKIPLTRIDDSVKEAKQKRIREFLDSIGSA